jgi:glycosyl transferase, family 25
MLKEIGIDGIYVVHAKTGYEMHEKHVNQLFASEGLNHVFMTDGDSSIFTPELLQKYFTPNIENRLSRGVLSCTLNHILCYEAIVAQNNRYAIIFENDPFFIVKDFKASVAKIIKEANTLPPGFIISIENTSLRFPPYKITNKNQLLYEAKQGRCAGAYIMDQVAAQNILQHLQHTKCNDVIDWWHNNLIDNKIIKMYWAYPAITEQGSHNGLLSSTISSKERSNSRRIKWAIQKFYKTYILHFLK